MANAAKRAARGKIAAVCVRAGRRPPAQAYRMVFPARLAVHTRPERALAWAVWADGTVVRAATIRALFPTPTASVRAGDPAAPRAVTIASTGTWWRPRLAYADVVGARTVDVGAFLS